jgi:hypothetical protein
MQFINEGGLLLEGRLPTTIIGYEHVLFQRIYFIWNGLKLLRVSQIGETELVDFYPVQAL